MYQVCVTFHPGLAKKIKNNMFISLSTEPNSILTPDLKSKYFSKFMYSIWWWKGEHGCIQLIFKKNYEKFVMVHSFLMLTNWFPEKQTKI